MCFCAARRSDVSPFVCVQWGGGRLLLAQSVHPTRSKPLTRQTLETPRCLLTPTKVRHSSIRRLNSHIYRLVLIISVFRHCSGSSSGSCVGHGSDCSHPDYSWGLSLEEQVFLIPIIMTSKNSSKKLQFLPLNSLHHRKKSSEGAYDLPHWDRTGMRHSSSRCIMGYLQCICLVTQLCISSVFLLQIGGRAWSSCFPPRSRSRRIPSGTAAVKWAGSQEEAPYRDYTLNLQVRLVFEGCL